MEFRRICVDIITVSWALFRVMIPTLIVVKMAQETGLVYWLNLAFDPITQFIGLQKEFTIVLTTTILTSPYTGLAVLAGLPLDNGLTSAQASVLGLLILFA